MFFNHHETIIPHAFFVPQKKHPQSAGLLIGETPEIFDDFPSDRPPKIV